MEKKMDIFGKINGFYKLAISLGKLGGLREGCLGLLDSMENAGGDALIDGLRGEFSRFDLGEEEFKKVFYGTFGELVKKWGGSYVEDYERLKQICYENGIYPDDLKVKEEVVAPVSKVVSADPVARLGMSLKSCANGKGGAWLNGVIISDVKSLMEQMRKLNFLKDDAGSAKRDKVENILDSFTGLSVGYKGFGGEKEIEALKGVVSAFLEEMKESRWGGSGPVESSIMKGPAADSGLEMKEREEGMRLKTWRIDRMRKLAKNI